MTTTHTGTTITGLSERQLEVLTEAERGCDPPGFVLSSPGLDRLSRAVGRFVRDVVPQGPAVPALKALHEAAEFAADPSLEEAADVLICLLGWAELNGLDGQAIVEAAAAKMQVNLARTWSQKPDGTWQHVTPTVTANPAVPDLVTQHVGDLFTGTVQPNCQVHLGPATIREENSE